MEASAEFLVTIGGILLLGLLTSQIATKTFFPRVTLLLIFGVVIGEQGLGFIPKVFTERFDLIADMTLLMVGFLLGGKLTRGFLQESASEVILIALTAALLTVVLVASLLLLVGMSLPIAIILACIASATAPAAIFDVIQELSAKSKFSTLLLLIVALDDVVALLLFGVGLALVTSLNGGQGESSVIVHALFDIGGATVLGVLIGLPAAYLTGRIKNGEPMLTEALGIVFLCGGLALYFEVSFLIASMVMGAVITNLAKHHDYPFHAIEGVEWPFMVTFFILAGASLDLVALQDIGLFGLTFLFSRTMGKYFGARLGASMAKSDEAVKNWMGIALLPQAGVPIGMALVAANAFPEYRQVLLSMVISTTVFFDIVGPVFSRIAIQKTRNAV